MNTLLDFAAPLRCGRRFLLMTLSTLFIAGCGSIPLNENAADAPQFDPFNFFHGNTRAWGIVQDWRGRVVRRFDVDIVGTIDAGTLVLDEQFVYADGERATRTWRLNRGPDGSISGTAGDIAGVALGGTAGNAMRWRYPMDLTVGGREYRVNFDDWMWQLDDRVLVNRSYIRKFGLTVAEVTIFMQREGA